MASEVLITGAGGMLGRAMTSAAERLGLDARSLGRAELDVVDASAVASALVPGTRFVVNCAAYTGVDAAEADEAAAARVNADAVGLLAARARDVGATLVHFSTDYVFDGEASAPYGTEAPRAPLNAYGRTKARGEDLLWGSGCRALLIRTSWVYAPWGQNFVRTIARLLGERSELRVVDDQRGRPTSAEWLARASLELAVRGSTGTFHVTDGGDCTWYGLAWCIASALGSTCEVQPCTTAEFPRPARRPRYGLLALDALRAVLREPPHYTENVQDVVARLER